MKNNEPPPVTDPGSTPGRLLLMEWRLTRLETTLANFTRALWSVAGIVVAALIVYYLTSTGGNP